jgi:sphingomyelin phosphodiesterase
MSQYVAGPHRRPVNKSYPAGYWGSNAECDIPLRTINLLLDSLKDEPLDLVLWTGDNTAHDIWQQSQSYNLNFTTLLTELMKKKLKTRVMPSLGNHESYPVNVYEWGKGNSIELNEGVAEAWGSWIGEQAT